MMAGGGVTSSGPLGGAAAPSGPVGSGSTAAASTATSGNPIAPANTEVASNGTGGEGGNGITNKPSMRQVRGPGGSPPAGVIFPVRISKSRPLGRVGTG